MLNEPERVNSTHRCEVVPVVLQPHGNADTLSVVEVWGYTCVVRTSDWAGVDRGVYIPPDSVVPDTEDYAFLKGRRRIKVAKLRGVISQGLLVKAPEDANIGDDVAEQLGITHYNPPMSTKRSGSRPGQDFEVGDNIPGPSGVVTLSYDLEAARRYAKQVFTDGEVCWVTEKLHGANARFVHDGNEMFVGSRNRWKVKDGDDIWNQALAKYPGIEDLCKQFPGATLYGEVYGQVQDLRYGKDGVDFAAFDILTPGGFLDYSLVINYCRAFNIPLVPLLGLFPFDWTRMQELAEGRTTVPGADHVREGICLRPFIERRDRNVGRHHLKLVGNGYYERE